jgi:hypothetical protein
VLLLNVVGDNLFDFLLNEILIIKTGGAATTVRTISRYPQWFRNRGHVFCNSVIGDFGESKVGVIKYSVF